jgi:hypothetical protein
MLPRSRGESKQADKLAKMKAKEQKSVMKVVGEKSDFRLIA